MTRSILLLWASLVLAFTHHLHYTPPDDTERLGMAIDYFQSGKYHEALLIFEELDKQYELNSRFRAYMGICYYHEWAYSKACEYLDEAIPQLESFAPHERSVYYFTDGESHFQLQQYHEAILFFEKALTVCFEKEKGEIYYRLGFCHMFDKQWEKAHDYYQHALDNYLVYQNNDEYRSRILQTAHMLKGCEDQLKKEQNDIASVDTTETPAAEETTDSIPNTMTEIMSETGTVLETVIQQSLPSSVIPQPKIKTDIPPLVQQIKRDTISAKVPEGVNIEEIYKQQVEIEE